MIWYLIILSFHGGALSVPQPSKELCISNAKFVQQQAVNDNVDYVKYTAFCIQGDR